MNTFKQIKNKILVKILTYVLIAVTGLGLLGLGAFFDSFSNKNPTGNRIFGWTEGSDTWIGGIVFLMVLCIWIWIWIYRKSNY